MLGGALAVQLGNVQQEGVRIAEEAAAAAVCGCGCTGCLIVSQLGRTVRHAAGI